MGEPRDESLETECDRACREVDEILRDKLFRQAHSHQEFLDLLQGIAGSLPAGIAYLDTGLTYCFVNEHLADINGLPAEFHLGRTVRTIVPDLAPEAEVAMKRVLSSGKPFLGFELVGETAREPGARKWQECYYPVIFDGEVLGLLAVVHELEGAGVE